MCLACKNTVSQKMGDRKLTKKFLEMEMEAKASFWLRKCKHVKLTGVAQLSQVCGQVIFLPMPTH